MKEDDFWKSLTWSVERGRYNKVLDGLKINKDNYKKILTAPEMRLSGIDAINPEFTNLAKELNASDLYINEIRKLGLEAMKQN